jgi:hypothetical protein
MCWNISLYMTIPHCKETMISRNLSLQYKHIHAKISLKKTFKPYFSNNDTEISKLMSHYPYVNFHICHRNVIEKLHGTIKIKPMETTPSVLTSLLRTSLRICLVPTNCWHTTCIESYSL